MTTRRKPKKYRHKRTGRIVHTRPVVNDQHEWDALDELGAIIAWSVLDEMANQNYDDGPDDPTVDDMEDSSRSYHDSNSSSYDDGGSSYDSGDSYDSGGSDDY
jgi:hypothetical protein